MAYTTIDNPELYFQVKTYTGNATDDTAITLDGDENMQPDLVWIKDRTNANHHRIYDAVRGATKSIYSSLASAEGTSSDGLKSFDSDGFTLGDGSDENGSGANIVAWCWKETADAGFDIVSYTGNGSNRTISHSLSAVPAMIIQKNLTAGTHSWNVYHKNLTSAGYNLNLNGTYAQFTSATTWNSTAPTSSVFSVGTDTNANENTSGHIAYLFAEKQGFSKFGSYKGNGNVDGPFIYTGFRPAWIMVKRTSSTAQWQIEDIKRDPFNPADTSLFADSNDADTTSTGYKTDFLSNGFKIRGTTVARNADGDSYIYMAFAEAPFVNSNGVPCNAR